jgi:hypothetical protein
MTAQPARSLSTVDQSAPGVRNVSVLSSSSGNTNE